jgi:hypothetical protein
MVPARDRRSEEMPTEVVTGDGTRIAVHVFPKSGRLRDEARRLALELASTADTEVALRKLVEQALRLWYPRVTIGVRDDLAGFERHERVWYVMRDGRIHRPNELLDRFYGAMSEARDTYDETTHIMEWARVVMEDALAPRPARRASHRPQTPSGS